MVNFKDLDMIGKEPELYFHSRSRFKTNIGALLTIMVYTAGFALMMYFLVRVIMRSNIVVVSSQEFDDRSRVNYNAYQQPFIITDQYGYLFDPDIEERMLTMQLEWFYTFEDGSFEQKNFFFKLERCDINKHFPHHKEVFSRLPYLDRHYCLPVNEVDFQLYGFYGSSNVYSATLVTIDQCVNGKWGKTNCLPEEEIRKKLQAMYLQLSFIDYNIDNNNLDTPGVIYLRTERLPISTNLFKRFFYEMTPVKYKTDVGLIFEEVIEDDFFTVGNFMLQPASGYNVSFAGFTFSLTRNKTTVVKTFEKLQQVLSNIGGSIKALVMAGSIVSMFFTNNNYYELLINNLFNNGFSDHGAIKGTQAAKQVATINITNASMKNISANNFVKGAPFKKKQVKMHKVTFMNNIKMRLFCHKNLEMNVWNKAMQVLKERLSIETMIKKTTEVDRLKMLLLDSRTIPLFNQFHLLNFASVHGIWNEINEPSSMEQAAIAAEKIKDDCKNMVEEKLIDYYRQLKVID